MMKIIEINNKNYILTDDKHGVNIYDKDGKLMSDFNNNFPVSDEILEARREYLDSKQADLEQKIKKQNVKKYLVYDDDKYNSNFEYRIMDLKFISGNYYDINGKIITPNILVAHEADEEIEIKLKEREDKIYEYEQRIEEINDSFYDFIDRKRKDYESKNN